ncbi:hypothetical protein VMCG_08825 [Cytospora schulzeri]|uniref:Helicase C-terminal domain-containing protein n=1 Tax=Cytospora schulzeri TaxID=448051 RepID=A0A423VRY1_9PEZI|nr:hypothetical protein VMCG_08825 [Valsa malicola]
MAKVSCIGWNGIELSSMKLTGYGTLPPNNSRRQQNFTPEEGGTPIQNKLEDLVSLARFLQLPPISSNQSFQDHILRPLLEPQADSKPLRAYMETYCLRRSEVCLSLPRSNDRPILLEFSSAERSIYDQVLDDTRRQIDGMTTLHVLALLLGRAGMSYLQVDGDTSYIDRSHRLRAFKENPNVRVLLMTIETGAVGLNLTVANHVHIVEPQWNPSVEEQAIARALRMGQTREVTVFRYVLQNTVEQNIVKLQKKKSGLANFALAGTDQNVTDTLQNGQDLETVLDLKPKKRPASEI